MTIQEAIDIVNPITRNETLNHFNSQYENTRLAEYIVATTCEKLYNLFKEMHPDSLNAIEDYDGESIVKSIAPIRVYTDTGWHYVWGVEVGYKNGKENSCT